MFAQIWNVIEMATQELSNVCNFNLITFLWGYFLWPSVSCQTYHKNSYNYYEQEATKNNSKDDCQPEKVTIKLWSWYFLRHFINPLIFDISYCSCQWDRSEKNCLIILFDFCLLYNAESFYKVNNVERYC